MTKRINLLLLLTAVIVSTIYAQIPAGYYNSAKGKSGAGLKTALFGIIANHTQRSYNQLWDDFKETDMRPDGKVWDMYSNITNYSFDSRKSNYSKEGDTYNREHSFPKSWFNDGYPMYTDLFHLVPTDGYVNGRRSNYPYGEVSNPTWTSAGGFCKLGPCSTPGYSGTVFEPNDEYKGDFARNYFYMATAYEDKIASWSSPMLAGNKYPAYASWAITMLLRWAAQDPVSEKEIARNNAVYGIQHNRNPYIDYPGLEQYVWGSRTNVTFDPDNYEGGGSTDPEPVMPAVPVFSPAAGVVDAGTEVTITCATAGASIYYSINGEPEMAGSSPITIVIEDRTEIQARAMLEGRSSEVVKALYTLPTTTPAADGDYYPISSTAELLSGANYLIVAAKQSKALSHYLNAAGDVRASVDITIQEDGTISTETGTTGLPYAITISACGEAVYTLYDAANQGYLSLTSSSNKLYTSSTAESDDERWTISFSVDGTAIIRNVARDDRQIRYNAGSPRFACYTGSQQAVTLYRQQVSEGIAESGILQPTTLRVLSLDGRLIRTATTPAAALRGLPAGIYIVGGQKYIVR